MTRVDCTRDQGGDDVMGLPTANKWELFDCVNGSE